MKPSQLVETDDESLAADERRQYYIKTLKDGSSLIVEIVVQTTNGLLYPSLRNSDAIES